MTISITTELVRYRNFSCKAKEPYTPMIVMLHLYHLIIDREAREIMYLVASARLCVCLSSPV